MKKDEHKHLELKLKRTKWFRTRSPKIQEVILQYPPYIRYRMKPTGKIVRLQSYDEFIDGSIECQVSVLQEDNPEILFERQVFGVKLENLLPLNE